MNRTPEPHEKQCKRSRLQRAAQAAVEKVAHPLILATAFGLWLALDRDESAVLVALVVAIAAMEILERTIPAKPRWHQHQTEKLRLAGLYFLLLATSGIVVTSYQAILLPGLADFRTSQNYWPANYPILVQVLLLYFLADLIYYWIHRGIHRSGLLWRLSGHGMHHAFHNLHALNAGATHPLEVLFLSLPLILLAGLFGAPTDAVAGAQVLLITNAVMAHANVSMDTPLFNWFFTTSNQHRRHHSQAFEQSNTNYACNAIIWDRIFRTYSAGLVEQTGIGPTQPGLLQLFLLPWHEPENTNTIVGREK